MFQTTNQYLSSKITGIITNIQQYLGDHPTGSNWSVALVRKSTSRGLSYWMGRIQDTLVDELG